MSKLVSKEERERETYMCVCVCVQPHDEKRESSNALPVYI